MAILKNKNEKEWALITEIANSGNDRPVLMLNLNRYTKEADFPNGKLYQDYMSVLADFLPVVGGEILWRRPALGHPVGDVEIHEVLAAWYPTHQAFLDLLSARGAEENYRLRGLAVESANIHRFEADQFPFEN